MAAAYNKYGVANYSADHRLIFDGDDTFVKVWKPDGGDSGISSRLSRSTFAHSAKSFPRKEPAGPRRQAVITSNSGSFRDMSQSEVDNITSRLNSRVSSCTYRRHGKKMEPDKSDYTPRHPSGKVTQERVHAITDRLYSRQSRRDEGGFQQRDSKPLSARSTGRPAKLKSTSTKRSKYYSGPNSDSDTGSDEPRNLQTSESENRSKSDEFDDQESVNTGNSYSGSNYSSLRNDRSNINRQEKSENINKSSSRPQSAMSERSTTSTIKSGSSYPRSRSHSLSSDEDRANAPKHSQSTESDSDSTYTNKDNRLVSTQHNIGSPVSRRSKSRRSRTARSPTAQRRYSSFEDSSSEEEHIEDIRRYNRKTEQQNSLILQEDAEADGMECDSGKDKKFDDDHNNIIEKRPSSSTSECSKRSNKNYNTDNNDTNYRPPSSQSKTSIGSSLSKKSTSSLQSKKSDVTNGNIKNNRAIKERPSSSASINKSNFSVKTDLDNGNSRRNSTKGKKQSITDSRRSSASSKTSNVSNGNTRSIIAGLNHRSSASRSISSSKSSVISSKHRPSSSASNATSTSGRSDTLNGNSRQSSVSSETSIYNKRPITGKGSRLDAKNGNVQDLKSSFSSLSSKGSITSGKNKSMAQKEKEDEIKVAPRSVSQASLHSNTSMRSNSSGKMADMQAKEARAGLLKVLLDEDKKKHGGSTTSLLTDDQSESEGDRHTPTNEIEQKYSVKSDSGDDSDNNTAEKHGSGTAENMDKYNDN